jgi:hypothetical protein
MTVSTATTSGQILTSAYLNNNINSGLTYISTTALSGSSVSIAGCFSSTYDQYLVVLNNVTTTASCTHLIQFATGTTDAGANYGRQRLAVQAASVSSTGSVSQTSGTWGQTTAGNGSFYKMEISQPNLARRTFVNTQGVYYDSSFAYLEIQNVALDTSTQYTGMVLTPSGTSYTAGTVTIYGYRKA